MISIHQATLSPEPPAAAAGKRSRWRPTATVLSLSEVEQVCVRLLTADDDATMVPGLMLSRDGTTWSRPRRCVKVAPRKPLARASCAYFVPSARDLEQIRAAERPIQVRVGIFAERADQLQAAVAVFTLSDDDDVIASPNWAGDHGLLDCAQLAADIAQHQAVVAEMDALCQLGGGVVVGTDEDGSEPELKPDYCFLRDVAARDLADAQQAYRDKGCAPSV